jgi:hypothetical protein
MVSEKVKGMLLLLHKIPIFPYGPSGKWGIVTSMLEIQDPIRVD